MESFVNILSLREEQAIIYDLLILQNVFLLLFETEHYTIFR